MVILGEGMERETEKFMVMEPERSKQRHNFPMPCLKWGNQRFLRCVKVNPNSNVSALAAGDRRPSASEVDKRLIERVSESEPERGGWIERADRKEDFKKSVSPPAVVRGSERKSKVECTRDEGIEAIRANKRKIAILRGGLEEERPTTPQPAPAEAETVKPWNMRTRRAACKAPNRMNGDISGGGGSFDGGGAKSLKVDERKLINFSPSRTETKFPRLRGYAKTASADAPGGEKRQRAKFSVSLSRQEIEEDFMAMTGHRPPRRPKKRPKIVQKQLDYLFPGLWLSEVTADTYKVPDAPETGKR